MTFNDGSMISRSIDLSQPGRAVYVGDSVWRFRIIEKSSYVDDTGEWVVTSNRTENRNKGLCM